VDDRRVVRPLLGFSASVRHHVGVVFPAGLEAAVASLRAPELSPIVDLLAWPSPDRDDSGRPLAVFVADFGGVAYLDADNPEGVLIEGRHPLPSTDPMVFAVHLDEAADPSPDHERNSYPLPWMRLSSFFTDPRSPDIAVVHTGKHFFPEQGGHEGEHGSLGVIQSRAPLVLSGAGVRSRGALDHHARLVDVMPTLAWVAGVEPASLADLDGVIRSDLVERGARYVIGLLWDGAHSGSLVERAASGELPGVARLLERGCYLTGGAVAEFPSLTLVNHTSMLTGVGPGRHGVVGNVYWDRESNARVVPNDASTWHRVAQLYRDGVTTLFEAVVSARPDARTASINEMTERGAWASTFALVRSILDSGDAGGSGLSAAAEPDDFLTMMRGFLPDPLESNLVTHSRCAEDMDYAFYSAIDLFGLSSMLELFSGDEGDWPAVSWWSQYTTDAAHHAGGPRSAIATDGLRDCDARLVVLLDHLDSIGALDQSLILLTADHGFESADTSVRGDWAPALAAALEPLGVPWRDEGPGFIYLGVQQ